MTYVYLWSSMDRRFNLAISTLSLYSFEGLRWGILKWRNSQHFQQ